jgi:hypothetical protein
MKQEAPEIRLVNELIQLKIIEKPYEVQVPNFIPFDVERPVFVDKEYERPVLKEVVYEKPIVHEKVMTDELTLFIKEAIEKAINTAVANLKFSFELPLPKIMRIERK